MLSLVNIWAPLVPMMACDFLQSIRRPSAAFVSNVRHVAAILNDAGKLRRIEEADVVV